MAAGRSRRGSPPGEAGPTRPPTSCAPCASRCASALHELIEGRFPARDALEAINAFSRRAPVARVARWLRGAPPALELDVAGASRADVVLSALAAGAVDLITGPDAGEIRACGAPGCVLLFLRRHPRREWCCDSCGNRARQARHYARTRAG